MIRLAVHNHMHPSWSDAEIMDAGVTYFKIGCSQVSLGRTSEGRSEAGGSCDTGGTDGSTLQVIHFLCELIAKYISKQISEF